MNEEQRLTVAVECYAGHRGEQTPRTLILGDRRIAVAEVLDAWLAPDYRYFKLRGADGNTYLVRHEERSNTWELRMFRSAEDSGSPHQWPVHSGLSTLNEDQIAERGARLARRDDREYREYLREE